VSPLSLVFMHFLFKEEGWDLIVGDIFFGIKDASPSDAILYLATIFVPIFALLAFVFNLIGWLKNNNKFVLIGGILYIFSLNVFSAPLCLVEYFGAKHEVKNKLLFYTMIYTLVLSALPYILTDVSSGIDGSDIYMIVATTIGIICNFIAWKTDIRKMKLIAGIVYVLGMITIIPAIICFVCFGKQKESTDIKNKLLFYTMLFTLIYIPLAVISGIDGFSIYLIVAISIGIICNFIAWKTDIRKMKLIAGIVYVLGIFTIIPAIICFVCFGKQKKQGGDAMVADAISDKNKYLEEEHDNEQ